MFAASPLSAATASSASANPADLAASTAVRPAERCVVMVVGGSSTRAGALRTMLENLARYGLEYEFHGHMMEALGRLEAGGVDAVLAFDDYVGRSIHRAMVEREIVAPLVLVRELPKGDPVQERLRWREAGVAECIEYADLSPTVLRVSLLGAVETHRAISRLQGADAPSVLDPDTGLFTTLALRRRISAAIEHTETDAEFRYSLLYVDTTAVRASGHLSPSDVAALRARVGRRLAQVASAYVAAPVEDCGYAVLLRGFEEGEDLTAAESLRRELQRPYVHEDDELHLDLGFGFARGRGLDANAEAALARAREEVLVPRTPHIELCEQPRPEVPPKLSFLASELALALEHEEFAITYQPIVNLQDEKPCGFEALIRWQHPDGTERPAADFINAANDTNLIVPIGYWCVEVAMRQMASWQQELDAAHGLTISLNLSAPQVLDDLFVERVRSLLMTTGLDPSSVCFEVEARTIAEHREEACSLIRGLAASGTRVWVEDFGVGPCTLDDLRGIPLDGLKIDRKFIAGVDGTESTSGRIRHIMTAAEALGVRTLGEGIENQLQANVLRWTGCELGQGYLYAAPMSLVEAYQYLAG